MRLSRPQTFKLENGKGTKMSNKIIVLSGGFDPLHVGHLRMIEAADEIAPVTLVVNSDDWLMRKKGYVFMPWKEREELLWGFGSVSDIVSVDDSDDTVCQALRRLKPMYFGNGGDRTGENTPEIEVCNELGIELRWNLGGGKAQSSSDLVTKVVNHHIENYNSLGGVNYPHDL